MSIAAQRTIKLCVALMLMALALLAIPGAAQRSLEGFDEVIEVSVINVETVVTDRSGKRVRGLTADDFRLWVDGVEVPIDYFSEIVDGDSRSRSGEEDAAGEVDSVRVPTNLLVFIDDYFALGAERDVVLGNVERQIAGLEPGDSAAVLAFDGKRLEVLSPWTDSVDELQGVLAQARKRKAYGIHRRAELRSYLRNRGSGGALPVSVGAGNTFLGRPDIVSATSEMANYLAYAGRIELQLDGMVAAATAGMRGLPAPEGRKVMLLLAGGWPLQAAMSSRLRGVTTGSELERDLALRSTQAERGLSLFSRLTETANNLGYTLYPVDVPGLKWNGPEAGADVPGTTGNEFEQLEEATLRILARETGGRALVNGLRTDALETTLADVDSYYWLGFAAERMRDGRAHTIRVEAVGDGLETRSRRSYVDVDREEEAALLVEAGLLVGEGEQRSALGVELGETKRVGLRKMVVPILLEIPLSELTLVPGGDRIGASVEITLGVMDKGRHMSDIVSVPARLVGPAVLRGNERASYRIDATLRRQRHDLVVTVRDALSGDVLSSRVQVTP